MNQSYRERLTQEKSHVLSSLGIKYDSLAQSGRVADEDQAQITHEEFVSMRINLLEYQKLKLVNEALERLAAGDYGICEECEGKIAQRRLEILPWAKYCVTCQERITAADEDGWRPSQPPPETH